jgi:hypothetical protein
MTFKKIIQGVIKMEKKIMNLMFFVLVLASLASCTEVDPDSTSENSPYHDSIIRKKQRTIRYNCDGVVTSDKVETINSLSRVYKIEPQNRSNLWNFRATGVQSDDTAGSLWGKKGKFTVDMSPTLFNIQVYPGLNEIRYQFAHCYEIVTDPVTDETQCAHTPEYTETKSFWLDIEYKVVTLEGFREVRPSEDSCNP